MNEDGDLPLVRRSGKSESAFRTISEVADELDVPQHVLRFWESKFPQVKPLKRGGGRRYYRPEDVALLRRIRDLLYSEGYTIKGVQKLLREGGHKDTQPRPDAEPVLPLMVEEAGELPPGVDDGEESEEAMEIESASTTPAEIEGDRFSMSDRQELSQILAELERLRGLLQPR